MSRTWRAKVRLLVGMAPPEPQRGQQHPHHRLGPPLAPQAGLASHVGGERLGLVEAALLEPDPGQQAHRPTQAAAVAHLLERRRGVVQTGRRPVQLALDERDPGAVLVDPGVALAVVERLVDRVGLLEQEPRPGRTRWPGCGHAPRPQRLRQAGVVVDRAEGRDRRPVLRGGERIVMAC